MSRTLKGIGSVICSIVHGGVWYALATNEINLLVASLMGIFTLGLVFLFTTK